MKTYFFSQLKNIGLKNAHITINFINENEASLIFKQIPNSNDDALIKIKPFVVTTTIKELDDSFLDTIQKPIQSYNSLDKRVKDYEEVIAETEKNTKIEQDKKKKEKELKAKADAAFKKVEDLINAEDFDYKDNNKVSKALKMVGEVLTINPNYTKAINIKTEINKKYNESSLFNTNS